ncbi:hypothetical protein ELI33_17115 [Rhizobium ruizarguesonis]|uniref:hypothetical protein n=1 Tax=Rhizobium ruizarguesonis TaxID=2081791 RepID=UPI001030038F|nr:hypothetical protein [Rhizobium ruizarguesonis]TAV38809.1 hypothetical protein ELI33_17115 [Rhizobium ruizarguesonis]
MKYLSPEGHTIVGTCETILATAWISDIDPETGEPKYDGGTEIHWDSQETIQRDGQILFVCSEGSEWTFDQLKPSPDDQLEAEGPTI